MNEDPLDRVQYYEDKLAPARGCINGLLLGAALWAVGFAIWWWWFR